MKLNTTRKSKRNSKKGALLDHHKKHWLRYIWPNIYKYRLWLDNYKCVNCGTSGNRGNPLQVHHLDYRYNNTDQEIQYCRTLCLTCHTKLHKNFKMRKLAKIDS
jgi:5-methylcytosine-specific restriction endonuclease McrA